MASKAAATKAPVVKDLPKTPKATPKAPVGPPRAPTVLPVPSQALPAKVRGWALGGALLSALGLLGAWVAASQGGLDGVQAAPLASVGALIASDALSVRLAGLAMALGGVGLGVLGACLTRLHCDGAAHRIMAWSTGALATTWIIAGMFLTLAADLATEWSHGAGAKAAFATANIIAGAPAAILLATAAGSAACVLQRTGHRMAMVGGFVITAIALVFAIAEAADIDQLSGAVAVLTVVWAGQAVLPLLTRPRAA